MQDVKTIDYKDGIQRKIIAALKIMVIVIIWKISMIAWQLAGSLKKIDHSQELTSLMRDFNDLNQD